MYLKLRTTSGKKEKVKGERGGLCNRTACQSPVYVRWYNHSTQKYYCGDCARKINQYNPEALEMYGHPLCTPQPLSYHEPLPAYDLGKVSKETLKNIRQKQKAFSYPESYGRTGSLKETLEDQIKDNRETLENLNKKWSRMNEDACNVQNAFGD